MKIIAGNHEIEIGGVYNERVQAEGQMRDGKRVMLSGGVSEGDLAALTENDWQILDGETVLGVQSGYNTLVRHEAIFAKIQTKQQEIDAALAPVLEILTDEQATQHAALFPEWETGRAYGVGQRVRYGGILYKCLTAHTSQDTWTPTDAPSLWAVVLTADGAILPWVQPDSTNAYKIGDRVTHNGKTWVSTVDNNVWEPGAYGWDEVV